MIFLSPPSANAAATLAVTVVFHVVFVVIYFSSLKRKETKTNPNVIEQEVTEVTERTETI